MTVTSARLDPRCVPVLVTALTCTALGDDQVLYDNGEPDGSNAYPNSTVGLIGVHRGVLDDFEVPAGAVWRITGMQHLHLTRGHPQASLYVAMWSDRDGSPDAPENLLSVTGYEDLLTGRTFFSRLEWEAWTTFEPVALCPGRHWMEGASIGPGPDHWLVRPEVTASECWVNYEDFGGLNPGTVIFGVAADLNFILLGEILDATSPPESFETIGTRVIGGLHQLIASDDARMEILNRPVPSLQDPAAELEVTGTMACESLYGLRFLVEASCTAVPPTVPQFVALYDFDAGGWERMDVRFGTRDDSVVDIVVEEDPGRFVEPGTRAVRARIRWLNPGVTLRAGWGARIDQVLWEATP